MGNHATGEVMFVDPRPLIAREHEVGCYIIERLASRVGPIRQDDPIATKNFNTRSRLAYRGAPCADRKKARHSNGPRAPWPGTRRWAESLEQNFGEICGS